MRNITSSCKDIYSPAHRETATNLQEDHREMSKVTADAGWLDLALDALDLRAEDVFGGEDDAGIPITGFAEFSDLETEDTGDENCGLLSAEDIELLQTRGHPPIRTS